MPFFAGFDMATFPGRDCMNWLRAHSNLSWCGYYLAPAPNRSPTGWPGQYQTLQAAGWGVVPIYVGQQDARTGTGTYTPSSILTADQGTTDAKNAVQLAQADGFPGGTYIYLDWEYGGLDANGAIDYIRSWIVGVVGDGTYMPAIYCSHTAAAAVVSILDSIDPTPAAQLWCWKVPTTSDHPYNGDLNAVPTPAPSGSGFAAASAWQRDQNTIVMLPGDAPVHSLKVDFSSSLSPNPAAPLRSMHGLATPRRQNDADRQSISRGTMKTTLWLAGITFLICVAFAIAVPWHWPNSYTRLLAWAAMIGGTSYLTCAILGSDGDGPIAALTDVRNRLSLPNMITLGWFVVLVSAYLSDVLFNLHLWKGGPEPLPINIVVPPAIWVMAGITVAHLVGTNVIINQKIRAAGQSPVRRRTSARDATFSDLVTYDEARAADTLDLTAVQHLLFQLAAIVVYAVALGWQMGKTDPWTSILEFPVIPDGFLALLGVSAAGNLVNRAIPR